MKVLILIAMLVSVAAFADSSDRDKAAKWIQSELNGHKGADFLGKAQDGRPCTFFLTDLQDGHYFVVVGIDGTKDSNDYIGLGTGPAAQIKVYDRQLLFRLNQSWGNDSKTNAVTVDLDVYGSLVSATGISDLKTITCALSGEVNYR